MDWGHPKWVKTNDKGPNEKGSETREPREERLIEKSTAMKPEPHTTLPNINCVEAKSFLYLIYSILF